MTSPLGPTLEHRVGRATRYIEQQLGTAGTATWEDTREHLAKTLGISPSLTIEPVLRAVIDLESTGALAHDLATERYRRPLPTDPQGAPLAEVAEAVLTLGRPTKADGGHRTIHQTFKALRGEYRHADVYRAMHERLKGRELELYAMKCWRARGELALAATRLADPTTTVAQALADERKLEAHLVDAYVATLGYKPRLEHPIRRDGDSGLFADVYDERRRLIIEAKATVNGLFPAIGQVHRYRYLMNLAADRTLVDRVAVLLPGEPSRDDLSCAASMDLGLDVIWQDGEGFEHRVLK
ncbi:MULTISPECIES: hypothetical protein [unclassified Modestobacter]|uniref:hypothetical protein n=1 Tax=unclassified Modestobacter TaxID=2643866 RepID=UPI0022AA4DBE|nr:MULTISPECIES: hypothetical protein [unclassified Modestobacter]MCZ2826117.1 hypothetical protein [Modestobacter sp. VKM Ac-2981]MCZ2852818.1 hypothetical protein [Modestobacter sp. VKM Ac-2982]